MTQLDTKEIVTDVVAYMDELRKQRDTLHQFLVKLILMQHDRDKLDEILDEVVHYLEYEY